VGGSDDGREHALELGHKGWGHGAVSHLGKVACVDAFLGGLTGWGGEGSSVYATENCPRHDDPFASACLSRLLCGQGPAPRCSHTSTFIHAQQGRDAGCGGRSCRLATRGWARAVEGGPQRSMR